MDAENEFDDVELDKVTLAAVSFGKRCNGECSGDFLVEIRR